MDAQMMGRSLAGREDQVVVGLAANAQLRLAPMEDRPGGMRKLNAHEMTNGVTARLYQMRRNYRRKHAL
ncbi:hypothetical protein GCM10027066_21440 [Dyella jejuensis]